ncbi:MAG: 50S ribosomal protein L32e [Methanomassiliicoccales archaeon]
MKTLAELSDMNAELLGKLKDNGIETPEQLLKRIRSRDTEKLGIDATRLEQWKKELEASLAKIRPDLPPEVRRALEIRRRLSENRPEFLRSEYYKAKRMGLKWRKPRGKQSKMRLCAYYRPKIVSIGYGGPNQAKGLHPSGFEEKLVHTVKELEGIDAKRVAVRIAHSVGSRKREEILERAEALSIRVLNR